MFVIAAKQTKSTVDKELMLVLYQESFSTAGRACIAVGDVALVQDDLIES